MNLVTLRDTLVNRLNTGWTATYPTVPVYYENAMDVDLDKVGDVFLRCAVMINSAEQVSVELDPVYRTRGRLELRIYIKDELGTRTALGYMDYLIGLFKHGSYTGVHTGTPEPEPGRAYQGWYSLGVSVPFWVDSNI